MSHRRPSGHRGPLFLGSLLVLLTEVVANFPNRYESQFQLPGPYVNWNHPVRPTRKSGAYGMTGHRGKGTQLLDASASLSHPIPRWLQNVQDRAENVNVSPRAAKSFGRSFGDAKNRLDETEDKIARRSFFLYGSRRRWPGEPSREEKEYADVRRALAAQRETYAYQNQAYARAPKFSVVGQWPGSRRYGSGRQTYDGGPLGYVDRREVCALKILDLDGDVCGLVNQLVQLGKLLKRRNLLLEIMSERRINSGSAVPQTLALYVDGVIRDLSTSNSGMKRFIDRIDAIHDANMSHKNHGSLFHGRRRMNPRKSRRKSSSTDFEKASSIERPTATANVTSIETSTNSTTLTDRSNKISDGDGEKNPLIEKRVTSTQTSSLAT